MNAIILRLFLHQGRATTLPSVDFSSEKACNDATKSSMSKTYCGASDMFTTVCVPK